MHFASICRQSFLQNAADIGIEKKNERKKKYEIVNNIFD